MNKLILSTVLLVLFSQAYALGLVDVYQDAVKNDQTFKQAEGKFISDKEVLPQARAALLPMLEVSASANKNLKPPGNNRGATYGYQLTAKQILFDWSAFAALRGARASANHAVATFIAAKQDLILRTAKAYFAVLQAEEMLRCAKTQKIALTSQLNVAKQRYQVGLDVIAAVYKAQAAYDNANVAYLREQIKLNSAQEDLRVITNKTYSVLNRLQYDFPLLLPSPTDIDEWTKTALAKNFTLKAARFSMLAAQDKVHAAEYAHAPTLNLNGTYGSSTNRGLAPLVGINTTKTNTTASIGLGTKFNIYSGGLMSSQAREAQGNYQTASAFMDLTYRQVVKDSRQAYLKVSVGVSQLKADQQAIKSNLNALKSAQAGYKVGTQTIDEVLIQRQNLYQVQTDYAQHRFDYLTTTLILKQAAGNLSVEDLSAIDQWLSANNKSTLTAGNDAALLPSTAANKMLPAGAKKSPRKPAALPKKLSKLSA